MKSVYVKANEAFGAECEPPEYVLAFPTEHGAVLVRRTHPDDTIEDMIRLAKEMQPKPQEAGCVSPKDGKP